MPCYNRGVHNDCLIIQKIRRSLTFKDLFTIYNYVHNNMSNDKYNFIQYIINIIITK